MLALIRNDAIVATVTEGSWVELPDGRWLSPVVEGWSDPAGGFSLATVMPAEPVPSGKRIIGTSIEMVGGQPTFVDDLSTFRLPTECQPVSSECSFGYLSFLTK